MTPVGNPLSWLDVRRRVEAAEVAGSLCPLTTDTAMVVDGDIRFSVHVLGSGERKISALTAQRRRGENPFLEPEHELLVGPLSPTHRLLLNKFPVLDLHLLIVTRDHEPQDEPLSLGDFDALGRCVRGLNGLGFYNSAEGAGASQGHKHLQLVPLPLGLGPGATPIDHLVATVPTGVPGRVPRLPFAHAILRAGPRESRLEDGAMLRAFHDLEGACGLTHRRRPFNLLVTRSWMMVVPRSQESFEGISVNALGFVGSLLVHDRHQLERIREVGPLRLLQAVAGPGGVD